MSRNAHHIKPIITNDTWLKTDSLLYRRKTIHRHAALWSSVAQGCYSFGMWIPKAENA